MPIETLAFRRRQCILVLASVRLFKSIVHKLNSKRNVTKSTQLDAALLQFVVKLLKISQLLLFNSQNELQTNHEKNVSFIQIHLTLLCVFTFSISSSSSTLSLSSFSFFLCLKKRKATSFKIPLHSN